MQNSIDATIYKLKSIIDEIEGRVLVNEQPTSPLNARLLQHKLMADESSRLIVYTPKNAEPRGLYVSNRAFAILSELRNGQWISIKSLKDSKFEVRKPVSELRSMGIIIQTSPKLKAYRLSGVVNLYPMGVNTTKPMTDFLPSLEDCRQIEREKAKSEIARRFSRINKHFELLAENNHE